MSSVVMWFQSVALVVGFGCCVPWCGIAVRSTNSSFLYSTVIQLIASVIVMMCKMHGDVVGLGVQTLMLSVSCCG